VTFYPGIPRKRSSTARPGTPAGTDDFRATSRRTWLLDGMKQNTSMKLTPRALRLHKETVRNLRIVPHAHLAEVGGAAMHTSFSCGVHLCTTHGANG
jgi:hypothetical protein